MSNIIQTTHIRSMLKQAIEACEKIESGTAKTYSEMARLLEGASINARHASAEIEDELFRFKHAVADPYI